MILYLLNDDTYSERKARPLDWDWHEYVLWESLRVGHVQDRLLTVHQIWRGRYDLLDVNLVIPAN